LPFRPRSRRSIYSIIVGLQLFSGNVELNLGPPSVAKRNLPASHINFGCFNIRSVVHKTTLLHDLIANFKLDFVALSETWIQLDTPPTIQLDVAPTGFRVLHVPRIPVSGGPVCGGDLAVVYRETFPVRPHPFWPTSFELQLVKFGSSGHSSVIAKIYRRPSSSMTSFLDKLPDVIAKITSGTTDSLVLCGDVNGPGDTGEISANISNMFDALDLRSPSACQQTCSWGERSRHRRNS
jgi:hypothetical protein